MTASNEGVVAWYDPISGGLLNVATKLSWPHATGKYSVPLIPASRISALQAELAAVRERLQFWKDSSDEVHDNWQKDKDHHAALVAGVEGLREKAATMAKKANARLDDGDDDSLVGPKGIMDISIVQAIAKLSARHADDLRALLAGRE